MIFGCFGRLESGCPDMGFVGSQPYFKSADHKPPSLLQVIWVVVSIHLTNMKSARCPNTGENLFDFDHVPKKDMFEITSFGIYHVICHCCERVMN